MSYNKILDNDIKTIKKDLINLVEATKSQYAKTFDVLKQKDLTLAKEVIKEDLKINDLQNSFTKMALWKIAKQQMVAGDLRLAIGGIIISKEIEKIADVAKHICSFTVKYNPEPLEINMISKMFDYVNIMLNIISSLIENYNVDHHQRVIKIEKELHNQFYLLNRTFINKISSSKKEEEIKRANSAIWQIKNLERAAEYLITIEETLQFIRIGKFDEIEETLVEHIENQK